MNNPIMRLCEVIYKSDLPNKADLLHEFNACVYSIDEYFDIVMQEQWYYSTTPKEEQTKYNCDRPDEQRRKFAHDDCVSACAHLNEICSQLGIENICDFDTSDRRKVAEFAGYIICMFYFTNINTNDPMTEWLDKCPLNSSESRIVLPQSSEDQQTLDLIESISNSFYNNKMPYIFYSLIKKCLSEYSFEPEAIFELFAEGCEQQIHRKPLDMEKLIEAWREKPTANELKTVSDTVVLDAATKLMDRFDEAFKELAK